MEMPRNHIKVDECKIKTRRSADKSTQGPLMRICSSLPISDTEDAEMKRDVKAGDKTGTEPQQKQDSE